MKQTIVGIFERRDVAVRTLAVLGESAFMAECLPRRARPHTLARSPVSRLACWARNRFERFMDAGMGLPAYADAMALGRSVIKVYVDHEDEAMAARRILETAGAKGIDALADDYVDADRRGP